MPEEHTVSDARRRERWIVFAIGIALVLGRSAIFLLWPESYFDADQAVFGLMAKHLAELRAFPLFMYGQTYMLAVESWLAAPLFALLGASAWALKLPLVAMNIAIAVLVGVLSAVGYVIGCCGEVTFTGMRYELISVLGLVGLGAWFLTCTSRSSRSCSNGTALIPGVYQCP